MNSGKRLDFTGKKTNRSFSPLGPWGVVKWGKKSVGTTLRQRERENQNLASVQSDTGERFAERKKV